MFVTKMLKGYSLKGFYEGAMFFGAGFVFTRHNLLTLYLPGHKTPLEMEGKLVSLYPDVKPTEEDIRKSITDLISRCPDCTQKHLIGLKSLVKP